ncbi:hypothetical protein Slala02_57670 [Streptomyces lavendulae subsp. lavendulae]|nr:hypothetical protein Slala01_61080 [Streptomyces lavendulae subsp. lavendulae]GLX29947.1 hypothetical protein Slala02_57670 [Streptomyces lavendulae subsp. lavendulae]
MSPDHDYSTARRLIDPDTNYTVHIRTDAGWTQPTNPDHHEVPGLDVLVAARRTLRTQPAGRVENTGPDELAIRTHDGVGVHPNVASEVQRYVPALKVVVRRLGSRGHPTSQGAGQDGPSRAPYGRRCAMGLRPTLDRPPCPEAVWLSAGPGLAAAEQLRRFSRTSLAASESTPTDGRLWLRFTDSTRRREGPGPGPLSATGR